MQGRAAGVFLLGLGAGIVVVAALSLVVEGFRLDEGADSYAAATVLQWGGLALGAALVVLGTAVGVWVGRRPPVG